MTSMTFRSSICIADSLDAPCAGRLRQRRLGRTRTRHTSTKIFLPSIQAVTAARQPRPGASSNAERASANRTDAPCRSPVVAHGWCPPALKARLAEHRAPLRWLEGHGRGPAALRTRRGGGHLGGGSRRHHGRTPPYPFAGTAVLRLVRQLLVREEGCSPAVQTNYGPQLAHRSSRSSQFTDGLRSRPYSISRRCFLRFRLRARACFARRLSPGFK